MNASSTHHALARVDSGEPLDEGLFRQAVALLETGVFIAEGRPPFRIEYANEAFGSLRGQKLIDLLNGESVAAVENGAGGVVLVGQGQVCLEPYQGADGKTSYFIGFQRTDCHEALKESNEELERKVQERTEELRRMNADLEGFTYSVSHDLRAPLRAIMGFSRVLVEDNGKDIDSEMRMTLDRIQAAAARMSSIIEDLLTFSRLDRKEIHRQPVDLSSIAEAIGADLVRRNPERDTTIGVDRGIVVEGDPTLLRMAVENLLDNAYKFTSKKEHGKIEFRKLGDHRFVVRDNGAGFEPQYGSKLFRPFERLHSASEYPGTGIGLANVRRIIERHGGRVWAEGEPEKGASFYFEL